MSPRRLIYYEKYCPKCHSKNVDTNLKNNRNDRVFKCLKCGFTYVLDLEKDLNPRFHMLGKLPEKDKT